MIIGQLTRFKSIPQVYTAMKLPKNKLQILVLQSEAEAREEHERYLRQREVHRRAGLSGGLVLFEEIGRIKGSAVSCWFESQNL